jgi:endoglucanase
VALHGQLRVATILPANTDIPLVDAGDPVVDAGDPVLDGRDPTVDGDSFGVDSGSLGIDAAKLALRRQLVDQYGAPIQLKGASSHWLGWETRPFAESKKALEYMRDNWKLSVIRAAMGTDQADGYLINPGGMKNKVETIIHHAIDLGVYVIVDWHTEKAVDQQEASVNFFKEMAKKYGAYPNVIWEPYNEPHGYSWAQIKPYHQAVVDAVRAVDPDNLIVLGTPNWSQYVDEAALDPVGGTNLLYTLHFYSCTHGPWLRARGDQAMAAGAALFVTEFGATFSDGGTGDNAYVCEDETNLYFDWMARNNLSGAAWKLDQCADTSCILNATAGVDGPWTDDRLSKDTGGALYTKPLNNGVSGTAIQGGHGQFVVNWIRR